MSEPDRSSPALTWADRFRWLIATCGGFSYCPILPGSCGALWGVLADDVLDSLYAAGLLHVLWLARPEWFGG